MKENLKEDNAKSTKIKSTSNQIRCNDYVCTKHHENANGDVVFHCKHKRKKENVFAAKAKNNANGDIVCSSEHDELRVIEVTEKF